MDGAGDKATAPKPPANVVDETPVEQLDERTREVADQTSDVVWSFMREHNQAQIQRSISSSREQLSRHAGTQTDDLLEVVQPTTRRVEVNRFLEVPVRDPQLLQIGHTLQRAADKMEQTYRPFVVSLVNEWLLALRRDSDQGGPLKLDDVWVPFKRIIAAVLETGITWSKILILLLFAYEVAVALYVENVPRFIRDLISRFVGVLIEASVVRWIAEHGGWAAAGSALWFTSMRTQITTTAPLLAWILSIGAIAFGAYLFVKRK